MVPADGRARLGTALAHEGCPTRGRRAARGRFREVTMSSSRFSFVGSFALFAVLLAAAAAPVRAQSRGELLYTTHCIECHTSQMHWRDQKLVTDWRSLEGQVRRWQGTALLAWRDEDILEVTRYLNDKFYRFERTGDPVSGTGSPLRAAATPITPVAR
jgi:mono/diheme cytochrome c family protein